MGIDPVTHKPLSEEEASQPPKPQHSKKKTLKKPQERKNGETQEHQERESVRLLINHPDKERDLDQMGIGQNAGICVDEVPLMNPDEILAMPPGCINSNSCGLSSSSSSSSSCASSGDGTSKFPEEMEFLDDFKWLLSDGDIDKNKNAVDTMNFLWDNDLGDSLDFLLNDDFVGSECPKTVLDTWAPLGSHLL
ncbi:PREDICTED: uncharacterized protein LOC104802937 [Tarenaya hassleriana]|uniref:uncharacterized protein LOC104802937 n=1 Tax=Tarenaya hassleriana TaxID=28532 RepID=UPI00053C82E0|nr:PREDICTED: uncharacterized protein LOC104802937 [Tarenaya hassleriana]